MLDNLIMYSSALLAVAVIVYMLIKKMDIKIPLFLMGIILLLISIVMGTEIVFSGPDLHS